MTVRTSLMPLRRRPMNKNARHPLTALLGQSVFGRLAAYGDINGADWLASSPELHAIVARLQSSGSMEGATKGFRALSGNSDSSTYVSDMALG